MSTAVSTTVETRYPPGDLAIWIFILAELSVFAIFFAAYAFTRMSNPELFNLYQANLDRGAALINTLALITSSYFVVRAVAAIRVGEGGRCARWLGLAIVMGLVFLGVKGFEYAHHFGQGITLSTNRFYMFYLSLTFFHFMHVILGLVILLAVYTLNFLDRQIVNILAEPIKADLGLSDTQLGLLAGPAFAVFYALLGIPIARYADKDGTNRVRLIAISLAIWSAMTAVCGLAQNLSLIHI